MPNDTQIKKAVEDRLFWDAELNESEVHVRVGDGAVTLDGTVPSQTAKHQAGNTATDVVGVTAVDNQLTVWRSGKKKPHSSAEVEQKIEKVLGWHPKLDRADIRVSVETGCVTLHGKVDSAAKRQQIEDIVRGVTGVLDVRNEIAIIPTEPSSGPAVA